MRSIRIDSKRRVVMPKDCPQGTRVAIEAVDENTWLVRRKSSNTKVKMIAFPIIQNLPDDPEWERLEEAFGRAAAARIPQPED